MNNSTNPLPDVLDPNGIADMLGLYNKARYQTVVRMLQTGVIVGRKCGRYWRAHRKSVENYLLAGGTR